MNLRSYVCFLFGQRQAILAAAGTRGLLGLGLHNLVESEGEMPLQLGLAI